MIFVVEEIIQIYWFLVFEVEFFLPQLFADAGWFVSVVA